MLGAGPDALPAADHVIAAYRSGDPKLEQTARAALHQMGPKVAPKLLQAFDIKDPKDARKLLLAICHMQPASREVVFAMLDCRSHADKGVRDLAGRYAFRPAATPYLCEALLDETRREAAIAFLDRRAGPSWRPELLKALPSLEKAARTVKGESQRKLLVVMSFCGPRIVPFLQRMLASTDDERLAALGALRRLGTQGFAALDAVIACLQDNNAKVQTTAIWTLTRIDAQNEKIVKAMVAAFDDAGADVRVALLRAIGGKGSKAAAPAMPLLARLMKGDKLALKYHAAGVLGSLRPDDPRPVEICRKGLVDYKGDELWEVSHAIGIHTPR